MQALLDVILPVFMVIGFGYLAVWKGYFSDSGVDSLMKFTQNFAIPCMLFLAMASIDLGQSFNGPALASFYAGSLCGFMLGLFGSRLIFGRGWEDAVVIGFCCLFSNSVLLGLPLTERAYGADSLSVNYAIIAIHAPFCYGIGIMAMETVRSMGESLFETISKALRAMLSNALIIAIGLGFVANLAGIAIPETLNQAMEMLARAALPVALFGLGGVLANYRPEGDLKVVFYICAVSLVLHPMITSGLGNAFGLTVDAMRSSVLTASMAPGINGYIFASIYGKAKRVAATSVLVATAMSVLTVWLWLGTLP
ncbi:MAG: AEC family transporter [Roseovarius sp.]|nr:AEC family transporter [Roseovarius sp.]MCY4291036.1 AEC family transporter [Roseovarius sp.]